MGKMGCVLINPKGHDPMQYLSDLSLAARLDIGRSTVWLWAKQGKLPQPVKLNGTRTRWRLSDIENWEKQQEVRA